VPRGDHRLTLLARVAAHLRQQAVPFALIGAAAIAVHGVSRATQDLDVLVLDPRCVTPEFWEPLHGGGVAIDVRRGAPDDPLCGVVRLQPSAGEPVDVVVGKSAWQTAILSHASAASVEGAEVPVATSADLVLLKLYAGGPQDAWDIVQLLEDADRSTIAAVEAGLGALPPESRALWDRIRESGR
jgi:hypothetical protein